MNKDPVGEAVEAAEPMSDSQGRPRLSPEKPALGKPHYLGEIAMIQLRANLSQVIPADGVQRRELHVIDGAGTETIYSLDPASVTEDFVVPRTDGATGTAYLQDFDAANNGSTPSPAVTFDCFPPDTNGPTQPTILSVDFVAELPDGPPDNQPQGERPAFRGGRKVTRIDRRSCR